MTDNAKQYEIKIKFYAKNGLFFESSLLNEIKDHKNLKTSFLSSLVKILEMKEIEISDLRIDRFPGKGFSYVKKT